MGVDNSTMHLADPEQLEQVGLTLYERKALMALMLCGVADAATLCREGSVPTSKIYLATEKLAGLGLVQVQPTRPKDVRGTAVRGRCARIVEIVRERSERFASQAPELQAMFTELRSLAQGHEESSRDPSRSARPQVMNNGLRRGLVLVVVLEFEGEFDGDRIPIALPPTDSRRNGQEGAVTFAIAPDARVPRHALNDGSYGRATPRSRYRWSQPFGNGSKGPSALPGISKESGDERTASLKQRATCRHGLKIAGTIFPRSDQLRSRRFTVGVPCSSNEPDD